MSSKVNYDKEEEARARGHEVEKEGEVVDLSTTSRRVPSTCIAFSSVHKLPRM